MALDFAVTSGLRADMVQASAQDPASPTTSYEDFKRNHLHTARLCDEEGLGFTPMVMEAHGGSWGPAAQKVFSELAKSKSIIVGEPQDILLTQLHQNLSIILHRENARAILKRTQRLSHNLSEVMNSAVTLQSLAADVATTPNH